MNEEEDKDFSLYFVLPIVIGILFFIIHNFYKHIETFI
jgi:hypothetical protein